MTIKRVKSELLLEEYELIEHPSGLKVYVFPKELSVSYAIIATKFGSVDNRFKTENEEISLPDGIAHFLEHKMFENEDGEDTFVKFAETGADANAYTSFTNTAYLFSCTSELYPSLEILLSSVFSPYFTKENVKKEQGIIAQEIKMGEDNPSNALIYGMLGCLYKSSPVKIDIAGSVESISKITPELLYKCHELFYSPANMILCVCGKVSTEEVIKVVDRTAPTAKWTGPEIIREDEDASVVRSFWERKMQVSKPLFCIGIKDIDISPDPNERMMKNAAMLIISGMYFSRSSEFYSSLYNDRLISPSFGSWCQHNNAFSFFSLSGDSDDPDEVYRRFTEYAREISKKPVCREDFERCRRALYSGFVKDFDSTEEIANSLVSDFACDGADIFKYAEILRDITPEYTERIAHSLFRDDAFALAKILPVNS